MDSRQNLKFAHFVVPVHSGSPRPKIRWFRNGLEIHPEQSSPEFSVSEDGALVISSASASHSGDFMCVATNEAGSVERKTRLKVNGEKALTIPILNKYINTNSLTLLFYFHTSLVPPEIQHDGQSLNLTVTLKQPLTLGCDAFGIPSPTITWSKDGHPVCIFTSLSHDSKFSTCRSYVVTFSCTAP